MGERILILGRAGTGKTRRLTDRVADAAAAGRAAGTMLLVPTLSQSSHLKRLLLSRYGGLTGFFDESVVTFTSLAERIFPDRPIRDLLSGRRQDLLLRRALAGRAPARLSPLVRYAGFRASALSFVKELKQNGVAGEEVADHLASLAEERGGAARERLGAFRELFLAYEEERTRQGLFDHEDFLREARDALRRGEGPRPAYLGVDGFQNFTRLERELLLALADRAAHTEVTLPFDPSTEDFEGSPFAVARETRDFLRDRGFREVVLTGNRRTTSPDLVALERGIFTPAPAPRPSGGGLRVLEGSDAEDEADRVARTILELVRGEAREWRDFVIVVRDAAARQGLFRHAFRRHGIPLRVYAKRDLSGHPFVRSVRDLLAVAGGDWARDRILALLRSDAVPGIARDDADRIEHELNENGEPIGAEGWIERFAPRSEAAAALLTSLRDRPLPVAPATAPAIRDAILGVVFRHLAPLADAETGDPDRIREEALAVAAVRAAAEEVAADLTPAGADADPGEFLAVFLSALRELEVTPRDRRLFVVNLIDAREARQWEAPVVIVSGLVEGEFPSSPREDIFLADRDRRWVNDRGGISLRERAVEREEERYLFYVAMTRARDRLYLTYPATDARGEATLPSLFLSEALSLFPDRGAGLVSTRRRSEALPREDEVADAEDLRRSALLGLADPYRPDTPEEDRARRAVALHDHLVGAENASADPGYVRAARLAARFFDPPRARIADLDAWARRHPPGRARSASGLTDFAQCPFLHFGRRTLRLEDPPRAAGEALDELALGRIGHEVLERLYEPATRGKPLPAPDDVAPVFEEVWAGKATGASPGLVGERRRARVLRSLVRLVAKDRERLARSGFSPRHVETGFGGPDRPLVVRAEDGQEVRLAGRVDRIDADEEGGAIVIDYKSTRGFDAAERRKAEAGTHLQLPLYLLAAREAFGLEPVGAWLYSIRDARPSGYVLRPDLLPGRTKPLDPEELTELLDRTRARVLELDQAIRSGDIAIRPADGDQCARCYLADVCRIEPWMRDEDE